MGLSSNYTQIMPALLKLISVLCLFAAVIALSYAYLLSRERKKHEQMLLDINEIRDDIIKIILQKGIDVEKPVIASYHPEYPDSNIRLTKKIELKKGISLIGYTVFAVGLDYVQNLSSSHLYYRVIDSSNRIYWSLLEKPCFFESNPYELQQILKALKNI